MDTIELFPDLPLAPPPGEGCARPIGRRGAGPRRRAAPRPRRSTVAHQLIELRQVVIDRLDEILIELRALRQQRRDQGEIPGAILGRLVAIERSLGVVEAPQTPRIRRRRPLE